MQYEISRERSLLTDDAKLLPLLLEVGNIRDVLFGDRTNEMVDKILSDLRDFYTASSGYRGMLLYLPVLEENIIVTHRHTAELCRLYIICREMDCTLLKASLLYKKLMLY